MFFFFFFFVCLFFFFFSFVRLCLFVCLSCACMYSENRSEERGRGKLYMIFIFISRETILADIMSKKNRFEIKFMFNIRICFSFKIVKEVLMITLDVLQSNQQLSYGLLRSVVAFLADNMGKMMLINLVHLVEIYWKQLDKDKMEYSY